MIDFSEGSTINVYSNTSNTILFGFPPRHHFASIFDVVAVSLPLSHCLGSANSSRAGCQAAW